MKTCTFKPLSRGRYRCVQTGKLVKKHRLKGYRMMLEWQGKARRTPLVMYVPQNREQTPTVTIEDPDEEMFFDCPYKGCGKSNFFICLGPHSCDWCEKPIITVGPRVAQAA